MEMQSRFNYLNLPLAAMGILFVLSLSGCQQSVMTIPRFMSEKGVNVEAFLPAESLLVAKFGSRDADQLDALKILNGYFPNDPLGAIVTEFNQGFKNGTNLTELGLNYEQDVLPILNNKSQFFMAMSSRQEVLPPGTLETASSPKVSFSLAMTIADEAKFDALLDTQIKKNLLKKEDYNGQSIYSQVTQTGGEAYLSKYMDTVFLTSNLELLKTGLNNVKANTNLLGENKAYARAMAAYKPNLAVAYVNLAESLGLFKGSDAKSGEEVAKMLSGTDAANIESEMLILTAEKDGIRMTSRVLGKNGVDLTKSPQAASVQAYLLKKIPAVSPIFYFEGTLLKSYYENLMKTLGSDTEAADGVNQMKEFLKAQGLDLEKDILTYMDKGVALLLEDTGTPIPGIGIYLDATSNLEGATKTVQALNKGFEALLAEASAQSPEILMLLSKEEVKTGKLWKFKLNLDGILAAAPSALSKKLSGQKVELYYGLLDDGVMTISLKADLDKVYGGAQVVEKSTEFGQAMNYVGSESRGLAYLSPEQMIRLVDTYFALIADTTGQAPAIPGYDTAKRYLEPLKSLIVSGGAIKSDEVDAGFFLHIAQ